MLDTTVVSMLACVLVQIRQDKIVMHQAGSIVSAAQSLGQK